MADHHLKTLIAEHPFFEGMTLRQLETITSCAATQRLDAGTRIFKEGGKADVFYLIRDGEVNLKLLMPGRGEIKIQTLHEGDVLGWSWLFPPYKWHFDASVKTELRVVSLDAACLREKCEADHELGYELMKRVADVMVQRLQAARLQMLDLYGTIG